MYNFITSLSIIILIVFACASFWLWIFKIGVAFQDKESDKTKMLAILSLPVQPFCIIGYMAIGLIWIFTKGIPSLFK